MPKIWQDLKTINDSLPDSLSNMDPRDASASKNQSPKLYGIASNHPLKPLCILESFTLIFVSLAGADNLAFVEDEEKVVGDGVKRGEQGGEQGGQQVGQQGQQQAAVAVGDPGGAGSGAGGQSGKKPPEEEHEFDVEGKSVVSGKKRTGWMQTRRGQHQLDMFTNILQSMYTMNIIILDFESVITWLTCFAFELLS